MNAKTQKKWIILLFTALTVLFLLLALWLSLTAAQRSDFRRIDSESYDTVFLSMFPIGAYDEADYLYFRAMTLLKADNMISGFSSLQTYMRRISESGNTVSTVYLGVRPDKITAAELSALAAAYPSTAFEAIVSYPSIEYWRQLSDKEYRQVLTAYCDFLSSAWNSPNLHAYFYAAEEWLVTNPALYTDDQSLTADAAKFVMTHSDCSGGYQVTSDRASEMCSALEQLTAACRTAPSAYPDLSGTAIVFFGDSVIGNYTDGMSIPGAVHGLTGAAVCNCGYGGNPAAMNDSTIITLPGIAAAFAARDLSAVPPDTQVYTGISEYIAAPPKAGSLCFVISYGLNDYFNGHPVSSDDPYDITTYAGAVRTAVICLREYDADARIFLCTPTYTAHPGGGIPLADYVDALISLAHELDVDIIDNYRSLGIDGTNHGSYLLDGVHPNERGRFLFAREVINAICK